MAKPWLFLDFDNTLMGTEKLAVPSLIRRFNELYGAHISTPLTLETFHAHFHGQAREGLCASLTAHYGITVDYPTLFTGREKYMTALYAEVGVEMAPHLLDTLRALEAAGTGLAFVSNNPIQRGLAAMRYATNGQGDTLARLFATNYFEAGPIQKPDPDIYLRALHETRADPARTLAVEDSVTGVKAAVAAGLKVLGYTGFADDKPQTAAHLKKHGALGVFDDWATARPLIAPYLGV